jgi:hypothetical protein
MERYKGAIFIALATFLTFFISICIATQKLTVGVWLFNPLHSFSRWWMPMLALLCCYIIAIFGFLAIEKKEKKMFHLATISLAFMQFLLALAVTFLSPLTWMLLAWLVINPASNAYFSTAAETKSLIKLLQNFDKKMPNHIQHAFGQEWKPRSPCANEPPLISHVATQSPGPIIFCGIIRKIVLKLPPLIWLAEQILAFSPGTTTKEIANYMKQWHNVFVTPKDVAAALWCAVVYIIVGCSTVFFLVHIGKLTKNLQVGWGSAVLFATMPAFHMFTPSVDQMYPLITAIVIFLIIYGLHQDVTLSLLVFTIAGFILAIGVFLNLGLVTLLPLSFLLTFMFSWKVKKKLSECFFNFMTFLASFLSPLLALLILLDCNLWLIFKKSDMLRMQLYSIHTPRPYLPWIWGNIVDFFVFIGIPLTIGFLWQILKELASGIKERSLSSFSPILWAFVITFVILLLSGKVRGEAARMWLFLTPMVIIPASIAFDEFGIWEHKEWLGIIIALQGLNNLILREFLRVWGI